MNDFLRSIIGLAITLLGLLASGFLRIRILAFGVNQKRLKRKYGIVRETPVLPYGPRLEHVIETAANKAGRRARFAMTSGSTGKAKRILYTRWRLLMLKFTFTDMFMRACYAFRIKRTCLYVFSSFEKDESLTSLLLDEHNIPNYFTTLQAPYRVQHHPAIQALVSKYGPIAVRLWILTISNPGVLYSTNPSTISTFLDELASNWHQSSKLISDWYQNPKAFDPEVHRVVRRIRSRDCEERLRRVATSDVTLPLAAYAPSVEAYICWTGGYVKPFLDRLESHLPARRYKLIPMYSMSTETVETLPYFRDEDVAFLPLAAGVVYEFIEESAVDNAGNLLNAQQLEPGKLYAMFVSDSYGLRRYQTDDLFLCRRKLNGLPDLAFARRRSLEYSFTGEKLTAEQLSAVFEQLREQFPSLLAGKFLTCVPSRPAHAVPHYNVLMIGDDPSQTHDLNAILAARCDQLLAQVNGEYRSKRASGRLGPIALMETRPRDFAEQVAENGSWETQFKFLPLYRFTC
jgi:hypothetical protein